MILLGDCVQRMAEMEAASIDAIVTDPPYSLGFMGKEWDKNLNHGPWAIEAFRVLKPGGYLLAFGGTRTVHRLASAIEDAGFEIRDGLVWIYASGFPKSLDVGKAMDRVKDRSLLVRLNGEIRRARAESGLSLADVGKQMQDVSDGAYGKWYHRGGHMFFETGMALPSRPEWDYLRFVLPIRTDFVQVYEEAEREITGQHEHGNPIGIYEQRVGDGKGRTAKERRDIPSTDLAKQWDGWGTALKPAHEPIVMARKPLIGTVAGNVAKYGTGALNIEETRIGMEATTRNSNAGTNGDGWGMGKADHVNGSKAGRWPSNVLLSDPELFDQPNPYVVGSGATDAGGGYGVRGGGAAGDWNPTDRGIHRGQTIRGGGEEVGYGDSGGYARFFTLSRYNGPCVRCGRVNGAGQPSSPPSRSADSAPSDAQTSLDGMQDSMASEAADAIPRGSTKPRRRGTTPEASPTITSPPLTDASPAGQTGDSTDITTTTPSLSMCDSCADAAMLESTLQPPMSTALEQTPAALGSYPKALIIPKADRADREPTLRPEGHEAGKRFSTHPTMKPTDLMRHLVRLVTPPGGTVLDCFLGSGSTAIACELEGFPWIGIEREPEYVAIAEARLNGVQRGLGLDVPAPTKAPPKTHPDLSKHQPKRRAPAENWSGPWAGTGNDAEPAA